MHAFNVYTPNIYIIHTSIHIHAYNLQMSIKIVNTNIEALGKMRVYCIPRIVYIFHTYNQTITYANIHTSVHT